MIFTSLFPPLIFRLIAKFEEMEKKEERTRRHNRDLTLKYGLRDSESDSSVDLNVTAQEDENTFIRGTVLVFLPGLQEIKT